MKATAPERQTAALAVAAAAVGAGQKQPCAQGWGAHQVLAFQKPASTQSGKGHRCPGVASSADFRGSATRQSPGCTASRAAMPRTPFGSPKPQTLHNTGCTSSSKGTNGDTQYAVAMHTRAGRKDAKGVLGCAPLDVQVAPHRRKCPYAALLTGCRQSPPILQRPPLLVRTHQEHWLWCQAQHRCLLTH